MADQAATNEDIISASSETTSQAEASTNDALSALVGEGKKFRDIAALAASKVESDKFIEKLKQETADLRAQLASASEKANTQHTLSEIMEALNRRPDANEDESQGSPQPKTVSLEDISRLVRATNAAEKAAEQAKENRMTVNRKLLEIAGGNAEAAKTLLANRTSELGLSAEQVRDMSERSPAALLELLSPGTKTQSGPPASSTRSTVNSAALMNGTNNSGERKLSWYTQKRREMGIDAFYNDMALQAQYQADLKKHGKGFLDKTS
jgi:hypothetical protein